MIGVHAVHLAVGPRGEVIEGDSSEGEPRGRRWVGRRRAMGGTEITGLPSSLTADTLEQRRVLHILLIDSDRS